MYEGEWVAGKRHGFGRLVHKNGVVIAGDWLEGKQHGTAVRHPATPGAGADRCHHHTTRRGPAIVVRHLLVKVAADTRAPAGGVQQQRQGPLQGGVRGRRAGRLAGAAVGLALRKLAPK